MKTPHHNTRQNESGAVAEWQLVDIVNIHCFTYPLPFSSHKSLDFLQAHPFSSLFTVELAQPPCPGFFTCKLGIMLTLHWNIILWMNGITICERDLQWVEYTYKNEVMKCSITNSLRIIDFKAKQNTWWFLLSFQTPCIFIWQWTLCIYELGGIFFIVPLFGFPYPFCPGTLCTCTTWSLEVTLSVLWQLGWRVTCYRSLLPPPPRASLFFCSLWPGGCISHVFLENHWLYLCISLLYNSFWVRFSLSGWKFNVSWIFPFKSTTMFGSEETEEWIGFHVAWL